jgi:hypothetical protein
MTGAQLSQFLQTIAERTPLDQVAVVIQFGEGEMKEIQTVRVVTELSSGGNGAAEDTVVIRSQAPKRTLTEEQRRAALEKAKKEAERREPRTKEGA